MRPVARARWLATLLALALCPSVDARADEAPPTSAPQEPPHLRILLHPAPLRPASEGDGSAVVAEEPAPAPPRSTASSPPPWQPDPRCDDDGCADLGLCSFVAGGCVAGSADDCEQSNACTGEGECFFDPEEQACSDGMELESPGTLAAGIAFTALGAVLVSTGVYLARSTDLCVDSSCSPAERESSSAAVDLGDGLAFGGVLSLIVGVAAVIAGSHEVLRSEHFAALPALRPGPGGGSLSWRF